MDRSNVLTLVSITHETDSIGQKIPVESAVDVFCSVSGISATEWFKAGEAGLRPAYRVTLFAPDYDGQEVVILDGVRYAVYRTYLAKNEQIELYLEKQVGV